ncbi:MAG: sigma-70 family RNA polymerase sigma factor, partial [Chitinophagaceae bacterium]
MLYEPHQDAICVALTAPVKSESLDFAADTKLPDQVLWGAFKTGDDLAFIKIYKNYHRQLFDYGCRYSTDKEMIKDCLHDFFLYLRKNRLGFSDTNAIKPYLFKAFRRRVIDYLKKNNHQVNLAEPSHYAALNVECSSEAIYINKQLYAEQSERLTKALSTLDKKGRTAIYYFYFKGH